MMCGFQKIGVFLLLLVSLSSCVTRSGSSDVYNNSSRQENSDNKPVEGANSVSSSNLQATNDNQKAVSTKFIYKPIGSNDIVPRGIDFSTVPEVIAFASCANQEAPQPLWDVISKNNPDLFLFAGDNVYAAKPETKPISAQYKKLNQIKEFRSFREKVPFLVTWDDNDYGAKNAGADNPEKEEAKKEFLNQWGYVRDSLRMNQGGIYHSKFMGGVKKKSPIMQVILLDTRWFRSSLKMIEDPDKQTKSYLPNEDKGDTLLGEEQWQWLEKQLLKPANLRIIVSSIQFVAENHRFEKWGNFPKEKERFLQLLKKTNAKNVFIVSGDRHRGTIAKMDVKGWGPLFDITSSSINKPSNIDDEADPSYLGAQIKNENFGLAFIDWQKKRIRFELRDSANNVINKIESSLK